MAFRATGVCLPCQSTKLVAELKNNNIKATCKPLLWNLFEADFNKIVRGDLMQLTSNITWVINSNTYFFFSCNNPDDDLITILIQINDTRITSTLNKRLQKIADCHPATCEKTSYKV